MGMTIVMRNVNQVRNNDIRCNHLRNYLTTKLFTKFKWCGGILKIDLLSMKIISYNLNDTYIASKQQWVMAIAIIC